MNKKHKWTDPRNQWGFFQWDYVCYGFVCWIFVWWGSIWWGFIWWGFVWWGFCFVGFCLVGVCPLRCCLQTQLLLYRDSWCLQAQVIRRSDYGCWSYTEDLIVRPHEGLPQISVTGENIPQKYRLYWLSISLHRLLCNSQNLSIFQCYFFTIFLFAVISQNVQLK